MARTKNDAPENEADALLEEIERLKEQLAAARNDAPVETVPNAYNGNELVDYMLPIIGADGQAMKPLFVCVNGESCAIQPGVPVRLKRKFLDALDHAQDQRLAAFRYMTAQQNKGRKALSEM